MKTSEVIYIYYVFSSASWSKKLRLYLYIPKELNYQLSFIKEQKIPRRI